MQTDTRSNISLRKHATPMQYTAIFHGCKNDNFQMKNCDIFLIFAQNIDRGHTLEPAVLTSTHDLCLEQKKIKCIPLYAPVLLYKSGV